VPQTELVNAAIAVALFAVGVALAVWATQRLLDGLVGVSYAARLPTFAIGALLSGFEAENVAVGLAAGANDAPRIALGTVFGGAMFLVCVALGLGGVLYPLQVQLPRGVLLSLALAPVMAGLALVGETTPRVSGPILLIAFAGCMAHLVYASRRHQFVETDEIEEALERHRRWPAALGLTLVGIVVIAIGGELVATGATRIVSALGVPISLMGMVVAPAAIELEEIVRQAVPAREGHPEVSAGNLVGTLLYFVLFNLGLVALLTPVAIDPLVRTLDWPALVGTTWLATLFLLRGRVGRLEGGILLLVYVAYTIAHLVMV
jgi:cation:H+ antiporter